MNKNLQRIVVCSAIVLVGLLGVGMMATPKAITLRQAALPPDSRPPEQVVYSAFFHFVVELQKEANDLDKEGKKGDTLRSYIQTQSGLNDEEARKLNEIAVACVEHVSQQDASALIVISEVPNSVSRRQSAGRNETAAAAPGANGIAGGTRSNHSCRKESVGRGTGRRFVR